MGPLLRRTTARKLIADAIAEKAMALNSGRFIGLFCDVADVFFFIEPRRGVLIDARKPLIAFYEAVQREPDAVHDELRKLLDKPQTERTFNQIRSKWNGKDFGVLFAAKFLYLNRMCAPGSFSVDLGQKFSATWGNHPADAVFPSVHALREASALLRNVRLYTKDYALIMRAARRGDIIYVDAPPCGVSVPYGGSMFGAEEQARLCRLLRRASDRGVTVLVSNTDSDAVRALYEPWADTETVGTYIMISSVGSYMDRKQMSLFG